MKASVRQYLWRALWIALISAALVALSYGITVWTHPQTMTVRIMPQNAESVLSDVNFRAVNARIGGDRTFRTKQADAQLYMTGIDRPVRTLCLQTQEDFPSDVFCQLYYARSGEEIAEDRSVKLTSGVRADQIVFMLPEAAVYETFRLDIDRDYTIRDILISADAAEKQTVNYADARQAGQISTPIGQMALGFLLLFVAGITVTGKMKKQEAEDRR